MRQSWKTADSRKHLFRHIDVICPARIQRAIGVRVCLCVCAYVNGYSRAHADQKSNERMVLLVSLSFIRPFPLYNLNLSFNYCQCHIFFIDLERSHNKFPNVRVYAFRWPRCKLRANNHHSVAQLLAIDFQIWSKRHHTFALPSINIHRFCCISTFLFVMVLLCVHQSYCCWFSFWLGSPIQFHTQEDLIFAW